MTGRGAQRKGARAERELAALLSRLLACECRKGSAPYLPGFAAPDVYGLPGLHVEVKRRELFSLPAAVRQSQADARPDETAIVCHRGNRAGWLVTVALSDLPKLAAAVCRLTGGRLATARAVTPARGTADLPAGGLDPRRAG